MARIASLVFLLLISLLACADSPTATSQRHPVPFATVLSESSTGVEAGRSEVIRDRAPWSRAWDEIHLRSSPQPGLPQIDFGQDMLLLVALGARPNGCFAVEIRSVQRVGSGLRVRVEESTPGAGCGCTQALVQPVHVVKLTRHPGPVDFEIRPGARSCS